jgi:PHD/YefM family antitoxin component YafN of YafNO toxin-antitoxin module
MTVADILRSVNFVVSPNGEKSAVVVDLNVWEHIQTMLEDAEDADEIEQACSIREEQIPWNVAKHQLSL